MPALNRKVEIKEEMFTICFALYVTGAPQDIAMTKFVIEDNLELNIEVFDCFDDCLIVISYNTSDNHTGMEQLGRKVVPFWSTICVAVNKEKGSVGIQITGSLNALFSFLSNAFKQTENYGFSIIQWDNPGKFGLFQISSGKNLTSCATHTTGDILTWTPNQWRSESRSTSTILEEEACGSTTALYMNFPISFKKTHDIAANLGGEIAGASIHRKLGSWRIIGDRSAHWVPDLSNGTWCEGK